MPAEPVEAEIGPGVRAHIERKLAAAASEKGVRVLLAVESGSRAWGFASPDSDYDVRFVYVHPRDWYVSLREPRDVIEAPLDEQLVDLAGWDVRKTLRLLLKANPALYEWLVSPITYVEDGPFRTQAKALFEAHASRKVLASHYWSIARAQFRSEIEGAAEPRLKKYFYVVRPLLSLGWVIAEGTPPPMQISELLGVGAMPGPVRRAVEDLLCAKRTTPELGRGAHIPVVDDWARAMLERYDPAALKLADAGVGSLHAEADGLFHRLIGLH